MVKNVVDTDVMDLSANCYVPVEGLIGVIHISNITDADKKISMVDSNENSRQVTTSTYLRSTK